MTNQEWEERYGQWLDPVRAPNGDPQVRLERVNELIDRRTIPEGRGGVFFGILGLVLAAFGVPWFLLALFVRRRSASA